MEDKADFSTVVIKANADDNENEDKFVDTDTKKNLVVDVLETEADCMGTHLTPDRRYITQTGRTRTRSRTTSTRLSGSQDIAIGEGDSIELDVDKEADTDGDKTIPVLQWLERKIRSDPCTWPNLVTSPSVYSVTKKNEKESAPDLASTRSVEETPTLHSCAVSSLSVSIDNRQSLPVRWTSSMTSTPTSPTGCTLRTSVQRHEEDVSLRRHLQGADLSRQSADRDSEPGVESSRFLGKETTKTIA